MAVLSYYVICTYVSPIPFACVDKAVYPPQKGDVSPTDDSETYEEKEIVVTTEKEIV